MKKLFILGVSLATVWQTYGQGTVLFQNAGASAVTNSLTSARVIAGTTFLVGIYFLPDSATPPTSADFNNATALFHGGFAGAGIYSLGTVTAPTTPSGGFGYFQVRAWESAFGSTYAEAFANSTPIGGRLALVGTSNILRIDTGDPTTTPAGTPAALTASGIQGFFVSPVPEPSVIGLGMLGIGALLLLRRRK